MKNQEILNFLSGPVTIPMTNDYLFRALLQRNTKVLRGLLCSLLHLKDEEIRSVHITNPIILGKAIDEKEFFLDINIELNDNSVVNLEMQVINEQNWPERSLSYLCRNFDNLNRGNEYADVKSAIQIGLLDFTLFPQQPEFYAAYQLLNVKNYTKYSDKVRIYVLDLKHIHLATEEDKAYGIDYWASLFKATTWEEIRMLAEKDENIRDASVTIAQLTQEETIRLQCEAREDYYRRQRSVTTRMERQEMKLQAQETKIEEQEIKIEEQEIKIEEQETKIEEQETKIEEQEAKIEEQTVTIQNQANTIEEQAAMIAALKEKLEQNGITAEE